MFIQLSLELRELDPETVEGVLVACGATSVTFTDARDDAILEPLPGEFRLWPATVVTALFGEEDPSTLTRAVAAALAIDEGRIKAEVVQDRAWEREWLKDYHAMRFGKRLWVCPRHENVTEPGAIVVRLDPGLAFGTGTHPTTALCLEWLERNIRPGVQVIDYGCGSGVLGVAAVKLGAARAQCFDIDPQALIATRDNAAENGVSACVQVCERDEELARGADVLVANILSGPLCTLAGRFAELVRPGGAIVLAGLMEHEIAEVTRAYDACFDMQAFAKRDDWVGLVGQRKL